MYEVMTTFNDGPTHYYEGERVSANNFDPDDLDRFKDYGWVAPVGSGAVPAQAGVELTLDIQDGRLGQATEI